jgi:hypothetical protein
VAATWPAPGLAKPPAGDRPSATQTVTADGSVSAMTHGPSRADGPVSAGQGRYTPPVCCPVCDLPVDPAWAAATGNDRHRPCTTTPVRMADAVRAHRAAHRPDHPAVHTRRGDRPARTMRPRPAPGPTTPPTRATQTKPSRTGPATACPRATRPRRSTTP